MRKALRFTNEGIRYQFFLPPAHELDCMCKECQPRHDEAAALYRKHWQANRERGQKSQARRKAVADVS